MWRWLGVRLIPHLPCNFKCEKSIDLAKKMLEIFRLGSYNMELEWLIEILSWPVRWTNNNGIAEINTPILKIRTNSDTYHHNLSVNYRC